MKKPKIQLGKLSTLSGKELIGMGIYLTDDRFLIAATKKYHVTLGIGGLSVKLKTPPIQTKP
jgi:hypothetical protein